MESIYLKVDGMSCGSCVNAVTRALTAVQGVSSVGVSLADGIARIEGTQLSLPAIEAAIAGAGYDAKRLDHAVPNAGASGAPARSGGCGSRKARGSCCCG